MIKYFIFVASSKLRVGQLTNGRELMQTPQETFRPFTYRDQQCTFFQKCSPKRIVITAGSEAYRIIITWRRRILWPCLSISVHLTMLARSPILGYPGLSREGTTVKECLLNPKTLCKDHPKTLHYFHPDAALPTPRSDGGGRRLWSQGRVQQS